MTQQSKHFVPLPETGRLSEDGAKRYFAILGFAVFGMSVAAFAAQFLLVNLIYSLFPSFYQSYWFSPLLSVVTLYGIGLPVLVLILRKLPKARPVKEKKGFGFTLGGLCVSFSLVLAGNYVSQAVMILMESLTGREILNPVETSTANTPFWVNLLFMVVLAPIMEELVFRKLLCDRLLPLGETYAIFLSAGIFALFHGNFYQLFYAFLVGVCFAYFYVKTGRIGYSIGFHMAVNFLFGVLPSLLMQYADMETLYALLEDPALGGEEWMTQVYEFVSANLLPLLGIFALSGVQMISALVGTILFIVFLSTKKLSFEEGILPPPKEARISPIFLNFGVAFAIAFFAFELILSLL